MPTPLVTQYYPDDFQTFTFQTMDRANNGTTDGSLASVPLIYADRDLAIDSITIGVSVGSGTSGTPATGSSMTFGKTTTGTLSSPATPNGFCTTATVNNPLTAAASVAAAGVTTPALLTPSNDTNIVRAGNWLGIIYTAGGGTLSSIRATVQIRFRSAIA